MISKQTVNNEDNNEFFQNLKKQINNATNIILFTGAGSSVVAGFPLANELLKVINKAIETIIAKENLKKNSGSLPTEEMEAEKNELLEDWSDSDSSKAAEKILNIIMGMANSLQYNEVKHNTAQNMLNILTDLSNKNNDNIENILSELQSKMQYGDDDKKALYKNLHKFIIQVIKAQVSWRNKEDRNFSAHQDFIKYIYNQSMNFNQRLKIFSLNYDECFEKALSRLGFIMFDGFKLTSNNQFNPSEFNYNIINSKDSKVINNIVNLYKLHGSITWEKVGNNQIRYNPNYDTQTDTCFIPPSTDKYSSSYKVPYFDLFSQLRDELDKKDNTLLIKIGYSGNDEHINSFLDPVKDKYNFTIIDINFTQDKSSTLTSYYGGFNSDFINYLHDASLETGE